MNVPTWAIAPMVPLGRRPLRSRPHFRHRRYRRRPVDDLLLRLPSIAEVNAASAAVLAVIAAVWVVMAVVVQIVAAAPRQPLLRSRAPHHHQCRCPARFLEQ